MNKENQHWTIHYCYVVNFPTNYFSIRPHFYMACLRWNLRLSLSSYQDQQFRRNRRPSPRKQSVQQAMMGRVFFFSQDWITPYRPATICMEIVASMHSRSLTCHHLAWLPAYRCGSFWGSTRSTSLLTGGSWGIVLRPLKHQLRQCWEQWHQWKRFTSLSLASS